MLFFAECGSDLAGGGTGAPSLHPPQAAGLLASVCMCACWTKHQTIFTTALFLRFAPVPYSQLRTCSGYRRTYKFSSVCALQLGKTSRRSSGAYKSSKKVCSPGLLLVDCSGTASVDWPQRLADQAFLKDCKLVPAHYTVDAQTATSKYFLMKASAPFVAALLSVSSLGGCRMATSTRLWCALNCLIDTSWNSAKRIQPGCQSWSNRCP